MDAFAGAAEDSAIGDAAAACRGMSFTSATKVLLASGLAVPIASLKPGDKVLATNTRTGKTRAEPVTAVLVHHDTNRYNLTVKTGHHQTAVIHTTTTHLFWNPLARQWVMAVALGNGSKLRTPADGPANVLGGYAPKDRAGWMWDLTVHGDHDFYIEAATVMSLSTTARSQEQVVRHVPWSLDMQNRPNSTMCSLSNSAVCLLVPGSMLLRYC